MQQAMIHFEIQYQILLIECKELLPKFGMPHRYLQWEYHQKYIWLLVRPQYNHKILNP